MFLVFNYIYIGITKEKKKSIIMDVLFGNTAILLFVTVICNMKEHLQIFRKTFQLKFFFFYICFLPITQI